MNNSFKSRLILPCINVSRRLFVCKFVSSKNGSSSAGWRQIGQADSNILRLNPLKCIRVLGLWQIRGLHKLAICSSNYRTDHYIARQLSQTNAATNECSDKTEATVVGSRPSDSTNPPETLDIDHITDGDPAMERKLKILFLELDVWHQEGKKVPTPSTLKSDQWKELLYSSSRSARQKYLAFLHGIEMKKLNKKRKKENDNQIVDQENRIVEDGSIHYGLNQNTIFMRLYETTMNQFYNNRLIQAIQFGQKIVFDCSYDKHMTPRESQNAAKQILLAFSENRFHVDPFNLYLCNANYNGNTLQKLHKYINTMYEDHFPLNVTDKSYLEIFPKEELLYLTPHCKEELTSYDHDTVYIIGAMVDKVNQEPLSLAKAKQEGIRMAKLPLDRYLQWGSGSGKSLTLNQMMLIMLELKKSGDWNKALTHVPKRKIVQYGYEDNKYHTRHQKQYKSQRDKLY